MAQPIAIENIQYKDLPAPIEKTLEFDFDDLHFKMMITDNILIPCIQEDGQTIYEMNCYKEQAQTICLVSEKKENRFLKLESEIYYKKDILQNWSKDQIGFVAFAVNNRDKFCSGHFLATTKFKVK